MFCKMKLEEIISYNFGNVYHKFSKTMNFRSQFSRRVSGVSVNVI